MEHSDEERYRFSDKKRVEIQAERDEFGVYASASGRHQYEREQTCHALATIMGERNSRMSVVFLWITLTYFDRNRCAAAAGS